MNEEENQDLQDDILKDELKEKKQQADEKKANNSSPIADELKQEGKKQAKKKFLETEFGQKVSSFFGKIKGAITEASVSIISVILIIFFAIGMVAYILNAPSLVIGNIKQILSGAEDGVNHLLFGSMGEFSVEKFDIEKRKEILNYISKDLGLDVIGFGFVPVATYKKDDEASQEIVDYDVVTRYQGELSDKEFADRDLVFYYLVASERAFIKNEKGIFEDGPFKYGILGRIFKNHGEWSGMLNIDDNKFKDAKIDRENETLNLNNLSVSLFGGLQLDRYSFSLDGWTGRFGNPLEFSLALHLSTMSSGMVKEFITNKNLQTEVNIGLKSVNCEAVFKINLKDSNGNIRELNLYYKDPTGSEDGLYNKIISGEDITHEDLSIQGLLYAIRKTNSKYDIKLGENATFREIGKHLKTIEAALYHEKLAVDISTDYIYKDETSGGVLEYEFLYSNQFPVYAVKDDSINRGVNINDAWEDYTISSGAYICSYDSNGNPDESTGKLSEQYVPVEESLDLKQEFEKIDEDDTSYKYQLKTYEYDRNKDKYVDVSNNYSPVFTTYIPKSNQTYVKVQDDEGNETISVRIDGLMHLSGFNGISQEEYDAYVALLKEIDWFMAYNICNNGWDAGAFNYKSKDSSGNAVSAEQIKNDIESFRNEKNGYETQAKYDFSKISYYTRLFEEAYKENNAEKYNTLYMELQEDYNKMINNPEFVTVKKEQDDKVQEMLKAEGLTAETVEELAGILQYNGGLEEESVQFAQPYIESVIKHWYKDVDFTVKANSYQETKSSITIPYAEASTENIDIQVELKPKKGKFYEQTSEPYVIKGDVVMCDGEYMGKTSDIYNSNDSKIKDFHGNDYTWGDGYRATKKIFTEGYYYTFTGSHDTARSIFCQQEIENLEKKGDTVVCRVYVRNGAIYNYALLNDLHGVTVNVGGEDISYDSGLKNENTLKNKNCENTHSDNNYSVYFVSESLVGDDDNIPQQTYIVYIYNQDSLKYLSPTENTHEEVLKRVETINNLWKAIGVVSLRQHLSFDNVTADGKIMATTGLSILKNCDTKDAEYIYRDLKEMLIDLGYYTQAEFDALETNVLKWFIPSYNTDKWPQNSIDDLDNFTAAVLYPYDETAEKEKNEATEGSDGTNNTETITSENINSELGIAFDRTKGFKENLDVIAPGDCIILSAENGILEIEFESKYQPEIAVVDGYTMLIEGVKLNDEITTKDSNDAEIIVSVKNAIANKTVIKAGSVIGKTGTDEIKVVLQNDIGRVLSNVNDYMAPDIGKSWDGKFSEEFLTYLAKLEGMPITTDDYFTAENNGVNWLKNEKAITVGPGLYLIEGNNKTLFEEKGYDSSNFGNYNEWKNNPSQFKFLKSDTVDVYIAALEYFKDVVEKKGLSNLTQNQFEALVLLVYNTGPGGGTFLDVIDAIQNGGDLKHAWTYDKGSHTNRRNAEYRLYTEGIYTVENLQMEFLSDTPFEDMIEGTTSFEWVNLK